MKENFYTVKGEKYLYLRSFVTLTDMFRDAALDEETMKVFLNEYCDALSLHEFAAKRFDDIVDPSLKHILAFVTMDETFIDVQVQQGASALDKAVIKKFKEYYGFLDDYGVEVPILIVTPFVFAYHKFIYEQVPEVLDIAPRFSSVRGDFAIIKDDPYGTNTFKRGMYRGGFLMHCALAAEEIVENVVLQCKRVKHVKAYCDYTNAKNLLNRLTGNNLYGKLNNDDAIVDVGFNDFDTVQNIRDTCLFRAISMSGCVNNIFARIVYLTIGANLWRLADMDRRMLAEEKIVSKTTESLEMLKDINLAATLRIFNEEDLFLLNNAIEYSRGQVGLIENFKANNDKDMLKAKTGLLSEFLTSTDDESLLVKLTISALQNSEVNNTPLLEVSQ